MPLGQITKIQTDKSKMSKIQIWLKSERKKNNQKVISKKSK